jgi:hypothetical protein
VTVIDDMATEVPSLMLTDQEFLSTFERGGFGGRDFPHKAHLRVAWLYLTRLEPAEAIDRAAAGIRNLAQANGQPDLYHETLTRAWVHLVSAAIATSPVATFTELLERHPELLDKQLLLQYYSQDVLFSPRARATWVPPDLKPLSGAPHR